MALEGGPPRVFCSYRSTDRLAVEEFAAKLRASGVDAWFDHWEIQAGDDVVARMDEGLDGCQAALIFVSHAWFDGKWAREEYTSLALRRVEDGIRDGIRLIPVMLEDVADRLPAGLRKLARRSVEQFDSVRDTLLGVDRKPGVATALRAATRAVTVELSHAGGRAGVALLVDGERLASVEGVQVPQALDLGEARTPVLLGGLGRRMGGVVFPGEVGAALDGLLDGLDVGTVANVRVVAAEPMAAWPFEAALLPSGRAPALLPAVRMWRTLAGVGTQPPPPAPGPLRILVAVGAPDEGQTLSVPLDVEAEIGSILDAVSPVVRDGRAQVRILEVAHPETIRQALAEDDYHVLHLSGHGSAGGIELEDEDGRAVAVSAADLAACLHEAGKAVPLVVLSSCHGGGSAEGFAVALHRRGVSRVVAMQGPVTDAYATELAAALYRELSMAPWPRVGVALAAARRQVEAARRQDPAVVGRPEWATPTLLLTGEDAPLVDSDLAQVSLRRPPVHTVDGPVPLVEVRDLIGRRAELRATLRAVRGHPRFRAEHGDTSGVVLTGIGGVGKSTIAGRAMARLGEDGWVCSATQGAWSLEGVCRALRVDLAASGSAWAGQLRVDCRAPPTTGPGSTCWSARCASTRWCWCSTTSRTT